MFAAATLPSLALLLGNQHGWSGFVLIAIGSAIAVWAGTRRELAASPAIVLKSVRRCAILAGSAARSGGAAHVVS